MIFFCLCEFALTLLLLFASPLSADPLIRERIEEICCKSNPLIAITVHYQSSRLQYLAEVLRSLATFPQASIILVTNTVNPDELSVLKSLGDTIFSGNGLIKLSIKSYQNLAHPFELTWCHKEIIANEFLANNSNNYTHFIYLEDDMSFNFANLCYFIEFREILRSKGLIPSYLRVEYREKTKTFVNTDNYLPINVHQQPHIIYEGSALLNAPNPYSACYVLDIELAKEYIASRAFDKKGSESYCDWHIRERAAMGLCFVKVPKLFYSRFVVPVSLETGLCPTYAWIFHLPNNYANDLSTGFGKIPMDKLFHFDN